MVALADLPLKPRQAAFPPERAPVAVALRPDDPDRAARLAALVGVRVVSDPAMADVLVADALPADREGPPVLILAEGSAAVATLAGREPVPVEAGLTRREREVLDLLAAGASNKVIARRLNLSFHTAKAHVASVLQKLGAGSRADAVARGARAGLVLL